MLLHTDEGLTGIGEADTAPYVARAIVNMPASHAIARGLADIIVGQDAGQIRHLWELMFRGTYSYGRDGVVLHVMSAIDMALWDLAGKAAGRPVADLLGGRRSQTVEVYASEVMPSSAADVTEVVTRAVVAGFSSVKLGWGPLGSDLGYDVELIGAARQALGLGRNLMIDAGMAYSVSRARELCRRCDAFSLSWLEEPFDADDFASYRRLSGTVNVPIACGEAHSTLRPFRQLIDHARVDVLQPDLSRCGGLTVAADIAHLADTAGVDVVPHCFSSDVHLAAALHFASSLAGRRLVEYPMPLFLGRPSLITRPFRPEGGMLAVPTSPGLGIDLDEDEVARRRVSFADDC